MKKTQPVAAPEPSTLSSNWQYETSVEKIEQMIQRIEGGELTLTDVFSEFEAAVAELQRCETFLMQHQAQVDLLIETLVDQDS